MKMASAMPNGVTQNGLINVHNRLIQAPEKPIVCIVIVDSNQTLVDHDKRTKTATIRVKHIEPMVTTGSIADARALLERSYKARTSEQLELEYEFETPNNQITPQVLGPFYDDEQL